MEQDARCKLVPKFPHNTVQDKPRIDSAPKTNSIHSAVSTEHQLLEYITPDTVHNAYALHMHYTVETRNTAITDGPSDVLCQPKFYQLLHNFTTKNSGNAKRLSLSLLATFYSAACTVQYMYC